MALAVVFLLVLVALIAVAVYWLGPWRAPGQHRRTR